jgi:hypothetical protein
MGAAQYGSFGQLSLAQVAALTAQEGPELAVQDPQCRFANLVYQVNAVPLTLSGDVSVDNVKIEGYDAAHKAYVDSDHNLYVKDVSNTNVLNEMLYSRIIQTDGDGNTYIAHATPGSLSGDQVWRAQKITPGGDRLWADDGAFNQFPTDLTSLTYTY